LVLEKKIDIIMIREPLSKRFSLVKVKAGENFNRRNTWGISRIKIFTQRRDRPKWDVLKLAQEFNDKMMRIGILRCLRLLLFSLLALLLSGGIVWAIDLPKVIDRTNCGKYEDLLIPAMYRAVKRGDYVIAPGTLNFKYKHEKSFLEASAKNAGKFDINSHGDLIDKKTGKYPENIYGYPFPNIDLKDPKAGANMICNFNFQRYRFMASIDNDRLMWIDNKGEERFIAGFDHRLYMNGRPPDQTIKNPDKVLTYEFQRILEPMSSRGTNTMSYIYIDDRENSDFAYIPAIRRIRQTTSTSRSDSYMGSDSWLDLHYMWAGKDSSMKWKLVGEKTVLASFTSPDLLQAEELPDGRVRRVFPYTDSHIKYGYQDPNWKGAPWTPLNITYVPRKVWIVEQIPKDPNYNWGLHINYVDQETYTIWYKEIYDKSGQFRFWCIFTGHYAESPSGKNNTGDYDAKIFIDERIRHATSVNRSAHPDTFIYVPYPKLNPGYFSVNNFLLMSK